MKLQLKATAWQSLAELAKSVSVDNNLFARSSTDVDRTNHLKLVAIGIPDGGLAPGSHCNLSLN